MADADDVYMPIDIFWEYESQKETEDDLSELSASAIREAVVSANDWTTETIISQIRKKNILLSPDFQRRDAWRITRKSRFIESLILGLPVPQLVLAEAQNRRGSYIVLDGKQRLLSICQFAADSEDRDFEQLRLSHLDIRKDLNGKTLSDMKVDFSLLDDVAAFENQSIRTVVIKNWPSESFLYHVFLRLNTNSVILSPQELRQALHPGFFTSFAEHESRTNPSLRDILGKNQPDFRMRDTELLIRYIAFRNFILNYKGNLKDFLDQSCKILNREWDNWEDRVRNQTIELNDIHNSIRTVFDGNAYHKWSGTAFENRFNRAIFDIMLFAFRESHNRDILVTHQDKVVELFKNLCSLNKEFMSSIEQTTKSMDATATRHQIWAECLNRDLGLQLPVLQISNDRLVFS